MSLRPAARLYNLKRIEKIIRLIENEEYKAGIEMSTSQNHYDEQLRLFHELEKYSKEYRYNYSEKAEIGVSISTMNNFNNFMSKLSVITKQQSKNVEQARIILDQLIENWRTKKMEKTTLNKLNSRLDEKSQYRILMQERKADDEIASRSFNNKK